MSDPPAAAARLWPPPLLAERPRPVQIVLVVVLPIAFGALCGYILGASAAWFQVLMLIAGIGGIGGGYEHAGPRAGFLRGLVGGLLFIGALVAIFELRGAPALAPMPAGLAVTAIVYAASGMPLGALGGWLRRRSMARLIITAGRA
jgi:hypothetical protein